MEKTGKARRLRRDHDTYIDLQVRAGNFRLIELVRRFLGNQDRRYGTKKLSLFDDLYYAKNKPSFDMLKEKYGISCKNTIKAFIKKINAFAQDLGDANPDLAS